MSFEDADEFDSSKILHDEYSDDGDEYNSEDSIVEDLEADVQTSKRKPEYDLNDGPKKKKKVGAGDVRPPTVMELNRLRETANLFHSNLFRMQIEEMLKELEIKPKHNIQFKEWFEKLKAYMLNLDASKEYESLTSLPKKLRVQAPISLQPPSERGKFRFLPPQDLSLAGSHALQACLGPVLSIDIHVHMPPACFQKTDLQDLTFHRKRALYLSVLARELAGCELVESASFVQGRGSPLKPVLELTPAGQLGQRVRVLLWPVTQPTALPLARLQPDRGNVRPRWLLGAPGPGKEAEAEQGVPNPPSPHYNCSVLADLVWEQNQQLAQALLVAPALSAGLLLLKVWLRQRRLDQGYGSFGGYVLAMYLAYLVQEKRITAAMSSYQVARITWNGLAQSDWTQQGISLSAAASGPPLSDFHLHFDVVFVDVSGSLNLCAEVSREVYLQVREESAQAMRFLDIPGISSFHALFMTAVDFEQCCDHIIRVLEPEALTKAVASRLSPEQQLTRPGWALPAALEQLMSVLRRGLGPRARALVLQPPAPSRWAPGSPPPAPLPPGPLLLGLLLDPEHCSLPLDRGPPADSPEAEEFRSFWGECSQLRRFRDGAVCEVVLWEGPEHPCQQAASRVLEMHLGLGSDACIYLTGSQCERVLQYGKAPKPKVAVGHAATQAVLTAYDALGRQLRGLKELPLAVSALQGLSPVLRCTEVFPPLALQRQRPRGRTDKHRGKKQVPTPSKEGPQACTFKRPDLLRCPLICPPVEAVVQLEHSSQWPADLTAVRRLKAAFCIQMAQELRAKFGLPVQAFPSHMDVYKDGYVFRVHLAYQREVALLKRRITANGMLTYNDTPESRELEAQTRLLPRLSSALHGLGQQFPTWAVTAQLVKRWVSAQLLGPPHIPALVTELLVASLFLQPQPFHAPVAPQLGLLRFLRLVSCTDWRSTPVLLNLNAELSREQMVELEGRFSAERDSLPPLFIATPFDQQLSQWTRQGPSLQVLIRLGLLAREALKVLGTQLLESLQPDLLPLFRPSLADYNAVIQLDPQLVARLPERLDERQDERMEALPYRQQEGELVPLVGFDPVQMYLRELRDNFSHCALFFYDEYGGTVIGVVWKPGVADEQDFKVAKLNGHSLAQGPRMRLRLDSVLEDFFALGTGLVLSIDNRTQQTNSEQCKA